MIESILLQSFTGIILILDIIWPNKKIKLYESQLGNLLIKRGFPRSAADPCLYTLCTNQGLNFIFVYVDDMLIAASSEDLLNNCKRYISAQWSITDLGSVSHYLGLKCGPLGSVKERFPSGVILDIFNITQLRACAIPSRSCPILKSACEAIHSSIHPSIHPPCTIRASKKCILDAYS